jgi:exodeoxyribonuclease V alpha subunit
MGRPRSGGPRGISRVRWLSTDVVRAVIRMHGGVKFYRGAAKAARNYVEKDCARYDDYYLAEGDGIAMRFVAETTPAGDVALVKKPGMDGETYEGWVAGLVVETGQPKGRLRKDAKGLRFVEVTGNGPKTWSLAAALNPEVSAALDAAQERAAQQIIDYLAKHATTRPGGADRGCGDPALHVTGRGYAPASAPSDQRSRLREGRVAGTALGWRAGHDRGDQRHRPRHSRH